MRSGVRRFSPLPLPLSGLAIGRTARAGPVLAVPHARVARVLPRVPLITGGRSRILRHPLRRTFQGVMLSPLAPEECCL